ncbi:MAG: protein phosphatase 1 regulatory subunit 42 [Candidatus Heimdallarchaeota archaeon]|nr:protein phosphatase 1 regulatory subunit 42 [Candidatus Heimdallarchaeota archaeon]
MNQKAILKQLGLKIKKIDQIWDDDQLIELYLYRKHTGKITKLDGSLTTFTSLRKLVIEDYENINLNEIDFSEFQNLQELSLRNNNLRTFPKGIEYLQNLVRINIDENKLKSVPEEIMAITTRDKLLNPERVRLESIELYWRIKVDKYKDNYLNYDDYTKQSTKYRKKISRLIPEIRYLNLYNKGNWHKILNEDYSFSYFGIFLIPVYIMIYLLIKVWLNPEDYTEFTSSGPAFLPLFYGFLLLMISLVLTKSFITLIFVYSIGLYQYYKDLSFITRGKYNSNTFALIKKWAYSDNQFLQLGAISVSRYLSIVGSEVRESITYLIKNAGNKPLKDYAIETNKLLAKIPITS